MFEREKYKCDEEIDGDIVNLLSEWSWRRIKDYKCIKEEIYKIVCCRRSVENMNTMRIMICY